MTESLLAAAFVIALLAGLAAWLKRSALAGAPGRNLRVLDQAVVGAGRSVTLVKAGQRVFLLGVGGESVALLAEIPAEQVVEETPGRAAPRRLERAS